MRETGRTSLAYKKCASAGLGDITYVATKPIMSLWRILSRHDKSFVAKWVKNLGKNC